MKTRDLTQIAMLSAVSLIIFVVEAQIPLPIAIYGVKLGLANVITLFTMWHLGTKEAGLVLLIRILLGNFMVGNLYTMLYSLSGAVLCFTVMALCRPLFSLKHIWMLGIFGAIGHNAGQLIMASLVTGTKMVFVYAPVLLFSAIITGLFTGLAARAVLARIQKVGI